MMPKKTLFFVGYPAILALGTMKGQTLLPRTAFDLPHIEVGVPYTDFIYHINQYILFIWQDDWNGVVTNKLHSAKPVLEDRQEG